MSGRPSCGLASARFAYLVLKVPDALVDLLNARVQLCRLFERVDALVERVEGVD